ncbi:MAG: DnaB-like helicase C-terminal domain-containing protein [archaeon]
MDKSVINMKKKELEIFILSCIIYDPALTHIALQRLPEQCFTGNERKAYRLLKNLYDSCSMTEAMLTAAFRQNGLEINDYLKTDFIPDQAALTYQCQALMDSYMSLEVCSISGSAGRKAIESGRGLDEVVELISRLEELLSLKDNFYPDMTISENLPGYLSGLEEEALTPLKNNTLRFRKLHHFNTATNGLQLQNLLVISGAWKSGKTTLALEMAYDLAANSGCKVGYISLEVSEKELIQKILSAKLHIPCEHLRQPQLLTRAEKEKLKSAPEVFRNTTIYLSTGSMNEEQIRARIRSWAKSRGVTCIFIDYVNLINVSRKYRTREEEVSYLSRMLKNLASELNVCIVALTQLNRTAVREKDSSAANLSESIALARDCNYLFAVSRPAEYGEKSITYKGRTYPADDIFEVKLCASRHSRQGVKFPLKLEDGELVELETPQESFHLD